MSHPGAVFLSIGLCLSLAACSSRPDTSRKEAKAEAPAPRAPINAPPAPPPEAEPEAKPRYPSNDDIPEPAASPDPLRLPTPQPSRPAEVSARHILIQFAGARVSKATRSREEALARAEKLRDLARSPGVDFGDLAGKFSDEPGSGARGGDLGAFKPGIMVPPFESAAFALGVGQVSDVVETTFGFHIIERTR